MLIRARLALILMSTALAGCAGMTPAERDAAEPDIREAVFRYQFAHGGQAGDVAAYFLRVDGGDPTPELLQRFSGHQPPVRPASQALVSDLAGVADPDTGEPAVLFTVDGLRWLDDDEVHVRGGYRSVESSAEGNLYQVLRRGGQWHVNDDLMGSLADG